MQNGRHKKIQSPKKKTWWGGGHFMTYCTSRKKHEGEDTSWRITRRAIAPNGTFSTLYFAAVSLHIHVEFLNDKRGNEKDRWCCCLSYWLNLSVIDNFSNKSLLVTWIKWNKWRSVFKLNYSENTFSVAVIYFCTLRK